MIILGIETSCDETAAALVTDQREIKAERLLSQTETHAPYGGVVPELASRAHLDHLDRLIGETMREAGMEFPALDGIAVTAGPGLIGGVIVGVMMAKAIAAVHQLPLMAVNHLEGHALTARLTDDVTFPYLLLLVSGGHCQFVLVEEVGKYQILGGTSDDALGEAFDKVAKMMGLGYPGGPKLEKLAKQGNAERFDLPMPLCDRKNCDFSFSGLKTAVRQQLQALIREGAIAEQDQADMAASFQRTAGRIMANRLRYAVRAARELRPELQTLVVAGGVAANHYLRNVLEQSAAEYEMTLVAPPPRLCTDNAVMIAWAGLERLQRGMTDTLDITPRARWPLNNE